MPPEEERPNAPEPGVGPSTSGDRVEQLAGDIAQVEGSPTPSRLPSSASGSSTSPSAPPPPPPPPPLTGTYRAPGAPEFDHLARLEPIKLPDVWFSGEPSQLLTFLRAIRDFLQPRSSLFQSETRRIVWISRHFGFCPSEHRRTTSPAENWSTSLVNDNARRQGNFDPYADLDGIAFTIPVLRTVESFIEGLITVFGDKFMKENAKRALASCKQRDLTIGEYNSKFCSLVYLVEDVEAARNERYVLGLNPKIIWKAMSAEWRAADTLEARMALATEAAAQLDLLALLPQDVSQPGRHRPLSSAPPPGLPLPPQYQANPTPRDPNAMEIDATTFRPGNRPPTILDISRSLCRSKNLCFCCLKPVVPPNHTGSLNCLNVPVLQEQRETFVKKNRQTPAASVAAIHPIPQPPNSPPLTYHPIPEDAPLMDPLAGAECVMGDYQNYDEEYDDYEEPSCSNVNVPVNTVHVWLDCTKGGRLIVPAMFKAPEGVLVKANILVDTGAMANFVSEEFVRRHDLQLRQRKNPIRCVGFDGREGVGGLVTQDWVGVVHLSSLDAKPVPLASLFGVTRLGSIDAIFGLPWLDQQGWVASGSKTGGHQFTLGSTPLYVMDSSSLGGKPEGELYAPSP
ncbi:hypothetical protein PCANC_13025 [Puccinia coronata f. sp. avenae]|uniref:Retrotransposon gag domain-containing protein n=1 Tax=Puccinia coronata f. sp. avenae TaxID=200324 RepID=A0A2N5US81_9BASI|nr:hypothetical protein PCANC_13025 [Puccinia coronata f. sp. avenae]